MGARYEAYLICKQRGHDPDYSVTAGEIWHHCRFCGTSYRTEKTLLESKVPEADE